MGKKRHNSKARNPAEVEIDNSAAKKITLDIKHRAEDYDTCNALVLPSEKRKTKSKLKKAAVTQLLSKKRRKQLEKVIEKKQKKLRRATLLEELAQVQAPLEELKQYVSITSVQTKGLKRHFREAEMPAKEYKAKRNEENEDDDMEITVNAIKGGKKSRLAILQQERDGDKGETASDPNVVGFDESSESESQSASEGDESDREEKASPPEIDAPVRTESKPEETPGSQASDASDATKSKTEETPPVAARIKEPQKPADKKPAVFVALQRDPEIQAARLKLPVVAEEQIIVEAINENPVVIVTGETGSGKTTQVPQFLYEAGYAREKLIGVTEPRRVAAMSMSKRVGEEMNLTEDEVSYLIRFEGNTTPETKIKFMTDGVLLKEVQSDFLLTKYSVIILDEAHERSVYTDILIGLLSRIVPLRNKRNNPLKLVIMSATLRIDEFVENSRLFKVKPPVLTVESRQFPVTIHFNRRTSSNYVSDALKKAVKIHTRLPDGGILIFLTGQREVNYVVRKLRKAFPMRNKDSKKLKKSREDEDSEKEQDASDKSGDDSEDDFRCKEAVRRGKMRQKKQIELPNINLDDYSVVPTDDTHEDLIGAEDDEELFDEDEDEDDDAIDLKDCADAQSMWVLPLYSLLPSHKQAKVFDQPPENCRLCVVSTNVAETSLTIPNIKYVVDCGRCKTRMYDKVTGVSTYRVCYTSKASANQRAGRAGRTGPGHCYRLYSSAVFNDQFDQFSQSEIQRKPVDDLLLQMKVMKIDKVVNFPFPTPPDLVQLKTAEKRLLILGALSQPSGKEASYSAKVTPLGHSIAAFPVAPRYGKMLALSQQHDLLQYTVCMVAALSVQEVLVEAFDTDGGSKNKWLQMRRFWAGAGNSLLLGDPMVLIRAVGAAEYAGTKGKLISFCEGHGLRHKAIVEIRKLRQQLTNEINLNVQDLDLTIDPQMKPPIDTQAKLLRQIVLAGMADQVARKVMPDEINEDQDKAKWKYAYKTLDMEDPVFMHSSCVLRKTRPEWVVYQEVYETNKMYMRGVTAIEPEWLPKFAPSLCQLGEPLTDPPPWYDEGTGKVMCNMRGTVGRAGWELPVMQMEHPLSVEGVKRFACFFLEGKVCPKLKKFVPTLLSTPQSINKTWAKLIPRTQEMTQLLLSRGVMSREKLLEAWETDRSFLLTAYQKWLPESAHGKVTVIWPPVR